MPVPLASILTHSVRIVLGALAAGFIWLLLSFFFVPILLPHIAASGTAVTAFMVLIATVTFVGAGYISARFITPNSIFHAGAAAFLITQAYLLVGASGPWYFGLYLSLTAAALAVVGAWLVRWQAAPPHNRSRGP